MTLMTKQPLTKALSSDLNEADLIRKASDGGVDGVGAALGETPVGNELPANVLTTVPQVIVVLLAYHRGRAIALLNLGDGVPRSRSFDVAVSLGNCHHMLARPRRSSVTVAPQFEIGAGSDSAFLSIPIWDCRRHTTPRQTECLGASRRGRHCSTELKGMFMTRKTGGSSLASRSSRGLAVAGERGVSQKRPVTWRVGLVWGCALLASLLGGATASALDIVDVRWGFNGKV